jgi:hypothetical protein
MEEGGICASETVFSIVVDLLREYMGVVHTSESSGAAS